jgi:hypothetical protein
MKLLLLDGFPQRLSLGPDCKAHIQGHLVVDIAADKVVGNFGDCY